MVWLGENRWKLLGESKVLFSVMEDPPGYIGVNFPVFGGESNELGAMALLQGKPPPTPPACCAGGPDNYIALLDTSGEWEIERGYYIEGLTSAYPLGWLNDTHVLLWAPIPPNLTPGTVYTTWGSNEFTLAVLDTEADTVGFLQGPFSSRGLSLRSVIAVQRP
jgi:hypothetical protein